MLSPEGPVKILAVEPPSGGVRSVTTSSYCILGMKTNLCRTVKVPSTGLGLVTRLWIVSQGSTGDQRCRVLTFLCGCFVHGIGCDKTEVSADGMTRGVHPPSWVATVPAVWSSGLYFV